MPDVVLTPRRRAERLKLRDRPRRGIGSPPHTTRVRGRPSITSWSTVTVSSDRSTPIRRA